MEFVDFSFKFSFPIIITLKKRITEPANHIKWVKRLLLLPYIDGILRKSTCRGKQETVNNGEDDSRRASSRGLIPKAKIKSVKMTLVIVFGKQLYVI